MRGRWGLVGLVALACTGERGAVLGPSPTSGRDTDRPPRGDGPPGHGEIPDLPEADEPRAPVAGPCEWFTEPVEVPGLGRVVCISPGEFTMGCEPGRDDVVYSCLGREGPPHTVRLTHAFWMMEAEVTREQYVAKVGSDPSEIPCVDDCPVSHVNWDEANIFAGLVNDALGVDSCAPELSPYAFECTGWRLPTEQEWEHAARAGGPWAFGWGFRAQDVGWFDSNAVSPRPGCTHFRNPFGLCDMSGNVEEWVLTARTDYARGLYIDPFVEPIVGDNRRIRRGGSYADAGSALRLSSRNIVASVQRSRRSGFRLVRQLTQEELDEAAAGLAADTDSPDDEGATGSR